MNIKYIIFIIIVLGIIGFAGFFIFRQIRPATVVTPLVESSGIEVSLPKPNEVVSSPLVITGQVTGNGWTGFEGQVGTVQLIDNAGKELATGILTATTEWTTLPTRFETHLVFSALPQQTGSLIFKNENPSGDPAKDNILVLPITFK